jgi:hypothetical protein
LYYTDVLFLDHNLFTLFKENDLKLRIDS